MFLVFPTELVPRLLNSWSTMAGEGRKCTRRTVGTKCRSFLHNSVAEVFLPNYELWVGLHKSI